ncbi:MAG: hypothetical protein ACI9MR_000845 [Myxococcota bacterium]|jgi:hypothetical protein
MANSPLIEGAPTEELTRSTPTARLAHLAQASELFMMHYERRLQLEPPEHWLPRGRPDLGHIEPWRAGVLAESKYVSFRHDQLLASFHPSHRAKWTGHELLHGLVGFAWRPNASPFFNALAARLAEVLPVALWYFLDETDLRRCERHAGQGALFGVFCAQCEAAASAGPAQHGEKRWLDEGRAYVERELASVRQAIALGRPTTHRFATLDLMSDAMAYTAANHERLASDEMARFVGAFFNKDASHGGDGHHDSLESLMVRIESLLGTLIDGTPSAAWRGGRARWIAQDLGWRLIQVESETDGAAAVALDVLVDALAENPTEAGVRQVLADYTALAQEWVIPDARDIFAVGYALPLGYGIAEHQLAEGLATVVPQTLKALAGQADAVIQDFVQTDLTPSRTPLAARFVGHLKTRTDILGETLQTALVEATVAHAPAADATETTFGWEGGVEETMALSASALLMSEAEPPLVIRRASDGNDVDVYAVPVEAMDALASLRMTPADPAQLGLEPALINALVSAGILVPARWRV